MGDFHHAFSIIDSENALAKIIKADAGDNQHWVFLLEQLAHPGTMRPVFKLNPDSDRSQIYNPVKDRWEKRQIQGERGRTKPTEYTKKTATSLLSHDGHMSFYDNGKIGLLFDLQYCKLHGHSSTEQKYIFLNNQGTNDRWWISNQSTSRWLSKAATLEQVRKKNRNARQNNEVPSHNEILARLSKKALVGIFATVNSLTDRLNILHKQKLVSEEIHLNNSPLSLPLMIITPQEGVREYTLQQQIEDIVNGLQRHTDTPAYRFASELFFTIDDDMLEKVSNLYWAGARTEFTPKPLLFYKALKNRHYQKVVVLLKGKKCVDWELDGVFKKLLKQPDGFLDKALQASLLECFAQQPKALSIAAKYQCDEVIEFFLKNYPLQLSASELGDALLDLVQRKKYDLAKLLLATRPDVSKTWYTLSERNTALHFAVFSEAPDKELILLLCQQNGNLKAENKDKKTALSIALERGHYDIVQLFLRDYANKFTGDQLGEVLLDLVNLEQYDLAKLLLMMHAEVSKSWENADTKNTAIHLAVMKKNPDIELIRLLCQHNDDINAENKNKETVLDIAIKEKHFGLVEFFFRNYAAKFTPDQVGRALLILVELKQYDLAKLLLAERPDANKKLTSTGSQNTVIHHALLEEKPDKMFIYLLCQQDIDLKIQNKDKMTALSLAIAQQQDEIFEFFLNKCSKKFTAHQWGDALLRLVTLKRYDYAKQILTKMPHTNTSVVFEATGNNAMHLLLQEERPDLELVALLCEEKNNCATLMATKNKSNQTALTMAIANKHYYVVEFLLRNHSQDLDWGEALLDLIHDKQYNFAKLVLTQRPDTYKTWEFTGTKNRAIHLVLFEEKPDMELVRLLCPSNASLKSENAAKKTALGIAIEKQHDDIVEFLLKKCADQCFATEVVQAFIYLFRKNRNVLNREVFYLIQKVTQQSALFIAIENRCDDLVALLLKNHVNQFSAIELSMASVYCVDKEAHKKINQIGDAFAVLFDKKKYEEITLLLENIKNVDAKQFAEAVVSATKCAIEKKCYPFVKELLQTHADKLTLNVILSALACLLEDEHFINLNFLKYIPGDVISQREIGNTVIFYLIDQAKRSQDLHDLITQLESMKNDLSYLYARQSFSGYSIRRHTWNGQPVSETWLNVMAKAQNKILELCRLPKYQENEKDSEFLSKKTTSGFKLFSTQPLEIYRNIRKKAVKPIQMGCSPG